MTGIRADLTQFLDSLAPGRDLRDLDSLALLQVVAYIEQNYAIRLRDLDVEPDDLRSLDGILGLIERAR